MSGKMLRWKEIKFSGDNLNKILITNPSDLPFKFAPKRDRSQSVDQLFNTSRSRLNSSLELTTLNKTRQQQLLYNKNEKPKLDKKEEFEKKTSAISPNLNLEKGASTQILEGSQQISARNSQLISEIKKQYQTFKKNILAELERQRYMMHKMVKELVLTFEYEIEKLSFQQKKVIQEVRASNLKEEQKITSLEDWKNRLASVSITNISDKQKSPELKDQGKIKKDILRTSIQKQQDLEPPIFTINFEPFLGHLVNLKRQMEDIDKVFDRPKQGIDKQYIKK